MSNMTDKLDQSHRFTNFQYSGHGATHKAKIMILSAIDLIYTLFKKRRQLLILQDLGLLSVHSFY